MFRMVVCFKSPPLSLSIFLARTRCFVPYVLRKSSASTWASFSDGNLCPWVLSCTATPAAAAVLAGAAASTADATAAPLLPPGPITSGIANEAAPDDPKKILRDMVRGVGILMKNNGGGLRGGGGVSRLG